MKFLAFSSLFGLSLLSVVRAQLNPTCFEDGMCKNSNLVSLTKTSDANGCLFDCFNNTQVNCQWFTYYPAEQLCMQFANCAQILPSSDCPNCVSGEDSCRPVYQCGLPAYCQGTTISTHAELNSGTCLERCQNTIVDEAQNIRCEWYTFKTDSRDCTLYRDCVPVDNQLFISGENDCVGDSAQEKIFIAGGDSGDGRAYIDVEFHDLDDIYNCRKPANLTLGVTNAVGTFIGGAPMICGGTTSDGETITNVCQKYNKDTDTWTMAGTMAKARSGAAGILISDTEWWITGGIGGDPGQSTVLADSEIYSSESNTWRAGPSLLTSHLGHCLTQVDGTKYMITGGLGLGVSNTVETYDFSSESWAVNPAMPVARYGHFCGTIAISGQNQQTVVAEGSNSNNIHNTYVYTNYGASGNWSIGPIHPLTVSQGASVQYGLDSFITLGGQSSTGTRPPAMYMYLNGGWVRKNATLNMGRVAPAAFLVPNDYINCGEP